MLTDEEMIESEVTYLPIIGTGPPTDLAAAQPDLSRCVQYVHVCVCMEQGGGGGGGGGVHGKPEYPDRNWVYARCPDV